MGAPDTYNGLGAVVSWAEKGKAPGALTANEYKSSLPSNGGPDGGGPPSTSDLTDAIPTLGAPAGGPVLRSIKLYPYPDLPVYKGHGSVKKASSYKPEVSKALMQPTPWLGDFDTTMIWCNSKGVSCKRETA